MSQGIFKESFRWFGPADKVSLADIRQSGATDIVTALHHIPNGEVWPVSEIKKRQDEVAAAGLTWSVVESVPVHEEIKIRRRNFEPYIENYVTTLQNLAACGIKIVTYNFMPILDWTRTQLDYELPNGAKALRFDMIDYLAFELYILGRQVESNYEPEMVRAALNRYADYKPWEIERLSKNIFAGLPGAEENFDLAGFKKQLNVYHHHMIGTDTIQNNLISFLEVVAPVAEKLGMVLALHPDDPPFRIFGLPRVVSSIEDYRAIFEAVPSLSNGICFCTGSLGVNPDNNLVEMINEFTYRIHFVHLRNTIREPDGSFYEAEHLNGDTDMYAVVEALHDVSLTRDMRIPMRPDHGHQILDDLRKDTNPGYAGIGRLKGLAELRGLAMGIERSHSLGWK